MFFSAEIIVVGSEFFTRFKRDSNSLWLTEQLEQKGIRVVAKRTVADDLPALSAAYREASARVDLVISTGGLGPTEDDRTRDAIALASGHELIAQQEIVDDIAAKFAARGRTMTDNNRRQALIPEGATVLPNPNGTAPGFFLELGECLVLALPGPPREMSAMYERFAEQTRSLYPLAGSVVAARVLKVAGLGESDMDGRISDLYRDLVNPELTINFTSSDLEIHLTARASTSEEADAMLDPLVAQIAARLEGYLFSVCGETLVEVVSAMLRCRGLTVSTAESVTGGLLAHRFASVPGASEVLLGGIVAYTEPAKRTLLGVQADTLDRHGVVSEQVAREMAEGVRVRLGTDCALSCTGYAGPGGGTERDPVGTAYLGLSREAGTTAMRIQLPGDRNLIRSRIAQAMLFWLYRELLAEKATALRPDGF